MLPNYGALSSKIGRFERKLHFRPIFCSAVKIRQLLNPVKDPLGLKVLGLYRIPCNCGSAYLSPTSWSVAERVSEHSRNGRKGQNC